MVVMVQNSSIHWSAMKGCTLMNRIMSNKLLFLEVAESVGLQLQCLILLKGNNVIDYPVEAGYISAEPNLNIHDIEISDHQEEIAVGTRFQYTCKAGQGPLYSHPASPCQQSDEVRPSTGEASRLGLLNTR
ncbi:hypothetical protein VNO77_03077 [Canavalia gladiata]|uniref:Uncharacterized protein n=1 Tax=Canavalia gladiata TaxID=3824 RepID=A0AAN9MU48_CANGL